VFKVRNGPDVTRDVLQVTMRADLVEVEWQGRRYEAKEGDLENFPDIDGRLNVAGHWQLRPVRKAEDPRKVYGAEAFILALRGRMDLLAAYVDALSKHPVGARNIFRAWKIRDENTGPDVWKAPEHYRNYRIQDAEAIIRRSPKY
jgi:hypothetical protein